MREERVSLFKSFRSPSLIRPSPFMLYMPFTVSALSCLLKIHSIENLEKEGHN
jgi:hypothetical protein